MPFIYSGLAAAANAAAAAAAPAAAGATNMLGNASAASGMIGNPLFAHLTNVKNRKFAREQYKTQRQDALSDWAMTNEYNSPRAQMQRFQEAGLNPNLIYGQMQTASDPRSSSFSGGQASAPRQDQESLFAGHRMRQSSAQTDLLAKQMSLMDAEIENKKAQTIATIASSGLTETQKQSMLFDLGLKKELRDVSVETKQWELTDLKTRQNSIQGEIMRAWQLHPGRLKEQALEILQKEKQRAKTTSEISHIEAMISRLNQEININKLSEVEASKNINPKDPAIIRWLMRISRAIVLGSD